jgi:hypothetical protein
MPERQEMEVFLSEVNGLRIKPFNGCIESR